MEFTGMATEIVKQLLALNASSLHQQLKEASKGELFVLNYLFERECEVIPGEISQAMEVSTARVASMLNSLEKKGYVIRKIHTTDRRKIIVAVTEEGREYVSKCRNDLQKNVEYMLRELGEHDVKEYIRIMERLIEIFNDTIWEDGEPKRKSKQ